MNDGILRPGKRSGKQGRMWSPRTVLLLAILLGATALTAACSAGSASSPAATSATSSADPASSGSQVGSGSPVASGSPVGSATLAGSVPANARQAAHLVSQWTACMRSHGDSGQGAPTIDSYDVIHVTIGLSVPGGWTGSNGQSGSGGPGSYCLTYMDAAEHALGGGPGTMAALPGQAMMQEYVKCMRANGVPNYTVPFRSGGGIGGLNSNSAAYLNATAVCFKATHVHVPGGIGPPGSVNVNDQGWVAGA